MSLAWLCARLTLAEDNPFGGKEEAMEKGEGVVVVEGGKEEWGEEKE